MNKQIHKSRIGKCQICNNPKKCLLECHRIIPGAKGGTYRLDNVVACCSNCHTLIHAKEIEVTGWFDTTAANGKILCIKDENGERFILRNA